MAYDFRKVKVLVVESSPPMFKLIKKVLGVFNIPMENICSAVTIEEGYERFLKDNHDILIVDWLHYLDRGVELTKKVRTGEDTPNRYVPIIMTAGSGHEKKVIRARDSGVSEYLVKPFSAGALADKITRAIEKPREFVICDVYTGPERRVKTSEFLGEDRRFKDT